MTFLKRKVEATLNYIKEHSGEQIAVSDIAISVGISHSNARYMLELLIKQGRIEKVPIKAMNKYYTRYTYNYIK